MMRQAESQPFNEMDTELPDDDYAEGTVRKGAKHKLRKGMKKIYRHTLETPLSRLGGKKQSKDKKTVLGKDVSLDYESAAKRQFGLSTKEATKLAMEQSLADLGKSKNADDPDFEDEEVQLAIALSLSQATHDKEKKNEKSEDKDEPLIDLLGPDETYQAPAQPFHTQVNYNPPPISYPTHPVQSASPPMSNAPGWGESSKFQSSSDSFMAGQNWSQAAGTVPMVPSMPAGNDFTSSAPPMMEFSSSTGVQGSTNFAPSSSGSQYQAPFYGNPYTQGATTAPGGSSYPQNQVL